ncbi:MAG: protein kinase, partial [Rhodospirillaceae bacterium]|nr:protein kinase [Rhodospirillaceae bacterium]
MRHTDHASALAPGTPLQSYAIAGVLGAGSFGITYLAQEHVTGRAVAIKEYLPSAFAVRERESLAVRPISQGMKGDFRWGLDRFRQEAKLLIEIRHPNVVPVLAYFEANGTGYLVMEFEQGESLADRLDARGPLAEAEVLLVMKGVLDGVAEVHRCGYLHRDLKPDNIFVRADGTGLLLDFGAARQAALGPKHALTAILTEGYAPFEQYAETGHQGPWTDIYALGAIMFRCLLGKAPVEAPKRAAAALRGAPDPVAPDFAALASRASPSTVAAINAALQQAESDRPQSVAALRAILDGVPPMEPSPGSATAAAPGPAPTPAPMPAPAPTLVPDLIPLRAVEPMVPRQSKPRRWPALAAYGMAALAVAAGVATYFDDHRWLPEAYRAAARKAALEKHPAIAAMEPEVGAPAWRQAGDRLDAERSSLERLTALRAALRNAEIRRQRDAAEKAAREAETQKALDEQARRNEEARRAEEARAAEEARKAEEAR